MQSAHEILVQIYVCFNACLRLRMHACMCACCLHVCMMLACVHMLVLVHFPCMLSPVQKCFQMCMPASMHPFVCAWMFAWMDVCKHGCVQTWMWANMDVCMAGCAHGWMCADTWVTCADTDGLRAQFQVCTSSATHGAILIMPYWLHYDRSGVMVGLDDLAMVGGLC